MSRTTDRTGAPGFPGDVAIAGGRIVAGGPTVERSGTIVNCTGLEPLEEAVRKMTSRSAWRLGLPDRGVLLPGNYADLVVFDPATIADRATYQQPRVHPVGIVHVVNRVPAVWDGTETGSLVERALRRQM